MTAFPPPAHERMDSVSAVPATGERSAAETLNGPDCLARATADPGHYATSGYGPTSRGASSTQTVKALNELDERR